MIDKQTNARLKRFAQEARRYLINQVGIKLNEILTPDSYASTYSSTKSQYQAFERELKKFGNRELTERVAYLWFNRFTAMRFMDMNHFTPVGIVSPLPGNTQPEILAEARLGHVDPSLISGDRWTRIQALLSGTEGSTFHNTDPQSEAYKLILISVCNYYSQIMPFLFPNVSDWTLLLIPDDLFSEHSILAQIRDAMDESTCEDVEVIGWLYQYYISEKKDEVFADLRTGKKVQSSDIPPVTQLFTPHWIVKYMVQNSLGRLWLNSHPMSPLMAKMEFYVKDETESEKDTLIVKSPEEIKLCDPCSGSGHILTYAFDLLYEIYSEMGYDPIEIPRLIINKNLYGIEIDERAGELAAFALTMKARSKDKLWFTRKDIAPKICVLHNVKLQANEVETYMERCGRDIFTLNLEKTLYQFETADTLGSLIVPAEQDIQSTYDTLSQKNLGEDIFITPIHDKVLEILEQADYLISKYQVVVTNPPYLGTSGFSESIQTFFKTCYPNSRSDFFAMFMERCLSMTKDMGYIAMINMQSWMFLSSYEKLRIHLVKNYEFITMAHLGPRAFDSISGEVVSTTTFVLQNKKPGNDKGTFFRLIAGHSEEEKRQACLVAITNPDCEWLYHCATSDFAKIPGVPIAYWLSAKVKEIFVSSKPLGDIASPRQGLATADNDRFLRQWFEPSLNRIGFSMNSRQEARESGKKWFPCNKGGSFRRWYGNNDYLVNWENDGFELRNFTYDNGKLRSVIRNPNYYFLEGWSWSTISSSKASFRFSPKGFMFETKGSVCFPKEIEEFNSVGGFLNSVLICDLLLVLSPTLDFHEGPLSKLPYMHTGSYARVDCIVEKCVQVVKDDWDSYETSWDFQQLPLLGLRGERLAVRECYAMQRDKWIVAALRIQTMEEENNLIFIEAYGLQDELSPEVPLKEITLTCNPYYRYNADAVSPYSDALYNPGNSQAIPSSDPGITRESRENHEGNEEGSSRFPLNNILEQRLLADTMKELISYAVGCMFGRYSIDKPGLILANQGESLDAYLAKIHPSRFLPDKDNVIPILDSEWFTDDIVDRFKVFLKVTFGEENFNDNLRFIEDAIDNDIRAYFIKDFYNDHLKRYKKRPIYWLFSSPKGSFNALIYMHRYTPDTLSIILNGYLREYLEKVKAKIAQLQHLVTSPELSERDKILSNKEIVRYTAMLTELEDWESEVLLPMAEKRIEIDLDDGVKVNYAMFDGALKGIRF
ncbi:MAG: BREX-1 system adenine-specific DNA-methyltransferase PglX [Candidatus Cloacimonadaceae bacterium]|nr:BREX-1 system adenine-specific DNA-methyltransferase PglX [Candidatus Cloacimonadaceae bacterium]